MSTELSGLHLTDRPVDVDKESPQTPAQSGCPPRLCRPAPGPPGDPEDTPAPECSDKSEGSTSEREDIDQTGPPKPQT